MSNDRSTITMDVPYPDHDGFVSWAENTYSSDRCSSVSATRNAKTGGSVAIHSGEHPAFRRFVKDVRPRLHEHGFVISEAKEDYFMGIDDEKEPIRRHVITAIPMVWVLACVNGNVCQRGACRHLTSNAYCEDCSGIFENQSTENEPRMINP